MTETQIETLNETGYPIAFYTVYISEPTRYQSPRTEQENLTTTVTTFLNPVGGTPVGLHLTPSRLGVMVVIWVFNPVKPTKSEPSE